MNSHEPVIPAAGPCEDRAFELMELADGALAPGDAAQLQRHVAACLRCRAFLEEFAATSAGLAAALPRPALTADFDARLRARIAGLPRTTRDDAAREWADREYREALDSLRRGLRWRTALNAIATAAAGGGVWIAARDVAPSLWASLGLQLPGSLGMALGLAAIAVAAGAGVTRVLQRSAMSPLG